MFGKATAALVALVLSCVVHAQTTQIGPVTRHAGAGTGAVLGTTPDMAGCVEAQPLGRHSCKATVTKRGGSLPPPGTNRAWVKVAGEAGTFMTKQSTPVAFGIGEHWMVREVNGAGRCTVAFFAADPDYGARKECRVLTVVVPNPPPVVQPTPPVVQPPTPGPAVTVSRTSGPAPLAVLFEVQADFGGTYDFDFGDPAAGTWPVSGQPRNTRRGAAIAAHVYDQPGTYTARIAGTSVTITVQDPAAAWPAERTVCVSTSSTWSGCPSGAAQRTTLPSAYAGLRVLLRRGESFGGINLRETDAGFHIGAFGTGSKPRAEGLSSGMVRGVGTWASDFSVADLDLGRVNIDATTRRMLLLRNDITRPGGDSMVNIGTAAGWYQANNPAPVPATMPWPTEVFLVENTIEGVVNANAQPNLVVMGTFNRSALLGNTMDRATEHTLRIWSAHRTLIAHNRIGGNHYAPNPPGIRGAVKIHSGGTQPFTELIASARSPATSRVALAHNIIGSSTFPGSFLSGFGPQNADPGTVEGLEDCVAENNIFVRGPHTSSEMQMRGRRMTARGNTVQGGGLVRISPIEARFDPGMDAWHGPYSLQ